MSNKILDDMRDVRRRYYSIRTERSYCLWVKRFILKNCPVLEVPFSRDWSSLNPSSAFGSSSRLCASFGTSSPFMSPS
jgi:hypothetical protein